MPSFKGYCFNPLSYYYSQVMLKQKHYGTINLLFQSLIVLLQSGHFTEELKKQGKHDECFNPLSYYYSQVIRICLIKYARTKTFQSLIVLLQSGHSSKAGKQLTFLQVSNHLTVLFYGTLQKSL